MTLRSAKQQVDVVVQRPSITHPPALKVEIRHRRELMYSEVLSDALTIGRHRENRFSCKDLPMDRLALLAPPQEQDPWILRYTQEMDGFLCLGDDTLPVGAIPKMREAQFLQHGVWIMPLTGVASFSIGLGHFRILGHPPIDPSHSLPRRVLSA